MRVLLAHMQRTSLLESSTLYGPALQGVEITKAVVRCCCFCWGCPLVVGVASCHLLFLLLFAVCLLTLYGPAWQGLRSQCCFCWGCPPVGVAVAGGYCCSLLAACCWLLSLLFCLLLVLSAVVLLLVVLAVVVKCSCYRGTWGVGSPLFLSSVYVCT
jgi:hypothetical protein